MIPSRCCTWTLRLTTSAHRSVARNQKRFRAFVRRIDKNNEVYYTIANKRPPKSPDAIPVRDDFFEMPDLLLDLDAEESPFVRQADESDERRLERRWDVNPKRVHAQKQLEALREQIAESRRRADDVLSNPANIWRLSPHDVLSAALRCQSRTIDDADFPATSSRLSATPGELAIRQDSGLVEVLCRENGIPPHALQDDQVLLEWMVLRYKNLQRTITNRSEQPLSPSELTAALKDQTSINGIRRLVFHSLSSEGAAKTYFIIKRKDASEDSTSTEDYVPRALRSACLHVLSQHPGNKAAAHLEILSLIGNLAARLSSDGVALPSTLTGLALRLSASAGIIQAASEWLHRGFQDRSWERRAASANDIEDALRVFTQHLSGRGDGVGGGGGGLYTVHDRQMLLQLLTGIDEHHAISSESFRSLALFHLGEQSRVSTAQAYGMYESYMALLGHLGALRTIWKEWHVSRPLVSRFLNPNDGHAQRLAQLFEASLQIALRRAVLQPEETRCPPDMELGECVALDYHSIGSQEPDSGTVDDVRGMAEAKLSTGGDLLGLPSFDLTLDEWLVKLEETTRQRPSSSQ
ncbi:hypothetical protein BBK36DRAFT_1116381 [Trichoderma citrinoviride]|uniref:Uncharacterized protein n=1 Tax=Trichoderma citrinoviride TaxID=58853 RepID=A0A2T4BDE9_9HYPO|nr:hypothetical protein BBK36DRAFT_1116381 [Trichoderma citrinoviride]PTB67335.1 hypothetical protein BBK36DRAFT_1116381 [Trichoderma citrinoviride]